jgi:hypothetical protein
VTQLTPNQQLDSFLTKYTPAVVKTAKAAFAWMRKRIPCATVLVYDNYNALVMGFGLSERASEAVLSIALYPKWVTLFFLKGTALADPQHRLKGGGKLVRSVVIEGMETLREPAVLDLIDQAAAQGKLSNAGPAGPLIIKSISAKQRPRRPKE